MLPNTDAGLRESALSLIEDDATRGWVEDELEILSAQFAGMVYRWQSEYSTARQVGYLAGLMDLDDNSRYYVLSVILDTPIATSKDIRITKGMMSILIEYYLEGNGYELNEKLGLESLSDQRAARRTARLLAAEQKGNRSSNKKANTGVLPMLETGA